MPNGKYEMFNDILDDKNCRRIDHLILNSRSTQLGYLMPRV